MKATSLVPRAPTILAILLLVLLASRPAVSHGEGGVPAQLDTMYEHALAHNATMVSEHVGLAADHVVMSDALSGLAADHDAQDAAHAGLEAQLGALADRLDYLDVAAEAGTAAVGGLPPRPPNEALVLLRVTFAGDGVDGLDASAFDIRTRIAPAGECSLEIDDVDAMGDGDYVVAVTPVDEPTACDWAAGDYVSSVVVTSPAGRLGSTLARVTVVASPGSQTGSMSAAQSSTSLLRVP